MKLFPWSTVTVFGIAVAGVVTLSIIGKVSPEVITTLVALLPGILASAAYSEHTNRAVRNGLIAEKAKEGAVEALHEVEVEKEND